jgi:hypothetical protein
LARLSRNVPRVCLGKSYIEQFRGVSAVNICTGYTGGCENDTRRMLSDSFSMAKIVFEFRQVVTTDRLHH